MAPIQMIDTERLRPHPDNPRKDLGDLEELTASVRQSGILQNLTVVPLGDGETYRIVIGHRRFAAAVRAGLTQVPCVVSTMDEAEQLATMMAENVQRHDLTAYEQIAGVGRMVQIGMDLPEIAQKTGISEKTVRRDAKLSRAFRPAKLRAAVEKGITIQDLIELQEIEDEKVREEVLLKYGQGYAFTQAKSNALYDQNRAKFREAFLKKIEGLPIHELKKPNERWSGVWDTVRSANGLAALEKMAPFTPDAGAEYAWYCEGQGGAILRKNERYAREKDLEKKRDKAIRDMNAEAERLNAECEDLRDSFISALPAGTKEEQARAFQLLLESILTRTESQLRWQTKVDVDDLKLVLLGDDCFMSIDECRNMLSGFRGRKIPDRRIAAALALNVDPWDRKLVRVERGRFVRVPAPDYALTYGILLELGYTITDLEQSLMHGTHPIFSEEAVS